MAENKAGTQRAILWLTWTARVLSILVIGVLLAFLIGEWEGPLHLQWQEMVMVVFFPLGLVVGMIWRWFKPVVGGAIGVASLVLFYVADMIFSGTPPSGIWFLIFGMPAYLFLAAGMLERGEKD